MFVAFEHLGALGSLHRIYQPGLRSLIVAQASASGVSVVLEVGQMLLPLGEQGRAGLGSPLIAASSLGPARSSTRCQPDPVAHSTITAHFPSLGSTA